MTGAEGEALSQGRASPRFAPPPNNRFITRVGGGRGAGGEKNKLSEATNEDVLIRTVRFQGPFLTTVFKFQSVLPHFNVIKLGTAPPPTHPPNPPYPLNLSFNGLFKCVAPIQI